MASLWLLLLLLSLPSGVAQACMEMASFRKLFRETGESESLANPRVPEAVVLFDGTEARAEPLDLAFPVVHRYGTGECVELLGRRVEPGLGSRGRVLAYQIRRAGATPGWVDESRVYVFDRSVSRYDYDGFLGGASLARDSPGAAPDPKLEAVESREFALRAARHPRRSVRVMGLRRLLGLSRGLAAVEPWLALQSEGDPELRYRVNRQIEWRDELPPDRRFWERLARSVEEEPERFLDPLPSLVAKSGHPDSWRLLHRLVERGAHGASRKLVELHPDRARNSPDARVRSEYYQRAGSGAGTDELLARLADETPENRSRVAELLMENAWEKPQVRAALKAAFLDPKAPDSVRNTVLSGLVLDPYPKRLADAARAAWLRDIFRKRGDPYPARLVGERCLRSGGAELAQAAARDGDEAALRAVLDCPARLRPRDGAAWLAYWDDNRLSELTPTRRAAVTAGLDDLAARLEPGFRGELRPVRFGAGVELEDGSPFVAAAPSIEPAPR